MTNELVTMQKQAGKAVQMATDLVVKDEGGYEEATALLGKVKTAKKLVADAKDSVLKPQLAAVKALREQWAPIEEQADEAERILKGKMVVYYNEKEVVAQKERDRIQREFEAGKIVKPETVARKMDAVETAPAVVKTATGGAQVRTKQVVTIVDASKLPREYLVPDAVLIRREALAGKEIPGVEVTTENIIAGI